MKTEICKKLGIEYPIFAFTHCRDVVVAVSKAGGIGVLAQLCDRQFNHTPQLFHFVGGWLACELHLHVAIFLSKFEALQ